MRSAPAIALWRSVYRCDRRLTGSKNWRMYCVNVTRSANVIA